MGASPGAHPPDIWKTLRGEGARSARYMPCGKQGEQSEWMSGGNRDMNFFTRKQQAEPPKERNEIGNRALKENLAEAALGALREKDDYGNLAYTKVEFGYLFQVEGRGTEALFKVTTDKTTVYFAVQGARLMRLNFSEELFQTTVDSFLELHG